MALSRPAVSVFAVDGVIVRSGFPGGEKPIEFQLSTSVRVCKGDGIA